MKINTEICEICRQEDCDGKLYEIKNKTGNGFYNYQVFCKNSGDIERRDCKLCYHWVMGHGIEDYLELIPFKGRINYTDKFDRKFTKRWY